MRSVGPPPVPLSRPIGWRLLRSGSNGWVTCCISTSSSLLKNPRQNESSLIQFFYHESVEARMRGAFTDQGQLFSYISPEARVRTDHPLRKIRELVRDVLGELNRSLSRLYACEGRPSIRRSNY